MNSSTQTVPLGLDIGTFLGGDAFPDVVVANSVDSSVSVLANLGTEYPFGPWLGLGTAVRYAVAQAPYDVELADLDGDADLDIVVTMSGLPSAGGKIQVLRNNGSGVFTVESAITVNCNQVRGLAVADYDNDDEMDIAIAGEDGGIDVFEPQVEILFGPSPYTTKIEFVVPQVTQAIGYEIISGLFRRPTGSRPDLVMSIAAAGGGTEVDKIFVMLNDGNRNFTTFTRDGKDSFGLASAKFRDGIPLNDLAHPTAFASPGFVKVYFGALNGLFAIQINDYELAEPPALLKDPYGVATGRIDGGTKQDIVIACQHGESTPLTHGGVAIFLGVGNGTFSEPPIEFAVDESGFTPKPRFVKTTDMDDDGLTDVVTSNASSHRIGVLISALQGGGP